MTRLLFLALALSLTACSNSAPPAAGTAAGSGNATASDTQHAGITTPHGDHSPHHGGMVLMNGELHYEIVFDRQGKHRIWFSDAVREDLPASIARDVRMTIARPGQPAEPLVLDIDESGESWVANGKPVSDDNTMVKVTYAVQGAPHEVEIPFLIPVK